MPNPERITRNDAIEMGTHVAEMAFDDRTNSDYRDEQDVFDSAEENISDSISEMVGTTKNNGGFNLHGFVMRDAARTAFNARLDILTGISEAERFERSCPRG